MKSGTIVSCVECFPSVWASQRFIVSASRRSIGSEWRRSYGEGGNEEGGLMEKEEEVVKKLLKKIVHCLKSFEQYQTSTSKIIRNPAYWIWAAPSPYYQQLCIFLTLKTKQNEPTQTLLINRAWKWSPKLTKRSFSWTAFDLLAPVLCLFQAVTLPGREPKDRAWRKARRSFLQVELRKHTKPFLSEEQD